ncbi:hypothetical protein J5N97_028990 [Dioscorea zingiberensis]|uniref:Protein MULTIPLE CHLOROPLAST DIVISION SITE 1 n=1 Tax=Dioscorea zingiberensis TaxID=325984 RepID=A0A9D5BZZ9_9LILI|nr:hypothetical protein J5N97_028990 [Dioscorea zingiberensis]
MASIPTALHLPRIRSLPPLIRIRFLNAAAPPNLQLDSFSSKLVRLRSFKIRATDDSLDTGDEKNVEERAGIEVEGNGVHPQRIALSLRASINTLHAPFLRLKRSNFGTKYSLGLCIALAAIVVIVVRQLVVRSRSRERQGSVADLVRRGQLRSDRRGISKPLRYDDPFNNPLVKVGKGDSTVEMFGKVYRLAPVILTKEQQSSHQKRRSQVYQWKRPTIFLKEGDDIPPDVDPDRVRWIPANHPFATTVSDIDENLARENVYQKQGAPFRIRVEHEALQRKIEALQNRQKSNKASTDPNGARDFGSPINSKPQEQLETNPSADQHHGQGTAKPDSDEISLTDELRNF